MPISMWAKRSNSSSGMLAAFSMNLIDPNYNIKIILKFSDVRE